MKRQLSDLQNEKEKLKQQFEDEKKVKDAKIQELMKEKRNRSRN